MGVIDMIAKILLIIGGLNWGLFGLFKVSSQKLSFILNHRIDLVTSQDPFILGFIY